MAEPINIFEYAVKNRVRFDFHGVLSVEDLYSLTVEELDSIFKKLNKELQDEKEESLLAVRSKKSNDLDIKIEIIKHIVADKQRELAERLNAAAKREKEQKILRVLSAKDDEALQNMSREELQALLTDMDK